jgi:hypothetical protein
MLKPQIATNNDIKSILDLAYSNGLDVGREFLEKAIADYHCYAVFDIQTLPGTVFLEEKKTEKFVGIIIFSVSIHDATILLLAMDKTYPQNELLKRLFYFVESTETIYEVEISVPEFRTELQIGLRDTLGMKCISTDNSYAIPGYNGPVYNFSKVLKTRKVKAKV